MMGATNGLFDDGEAYERMMGRWSRLVGRKFLDWLDVPTEQRWLDAGCGNGAFTQELVSRCFPSSVVAIDPSEEQLAYARERTDGRAAKFHVGDAQNLAFGDESFDVAVMALVISFLPEPLKAVQELTRVVRRGGWVATYMWDSLGGGVPVDPVYKAIELLGLGSARPPNAAASARSAMREFWERAGLDAIETCVIRIPVRYSNFDDFWNSNTVPIGPQGKLIQQMSTSQREQLRKRLGEILPTAADGRIAYEFIRKRRERSGAALRCSARSTR